MTIDKAIDNLRLLHSSPLLYETENYRDAVRLGVEALKSIKLTRVNLGLGRNIRLAGETEL